MTPSTCRRPLLAALLLLPLFSACGGPTYKAAHLEEAVRDICRREYGFDATARRVGSTLYAVIPSQHLVGADLGLQKDTIDRLYNALLTVTRVALSTDAKIDFLVVKSSDASTGVTLTLLRHVPDIKWYFYMRISRADFEDRGVMEIDSGDAADGPDAWHDITLGEFMARLAASRLQQKITYNPLVSVFVRVHRVRGSFRDGALSIRMDKFEKLGRPASKPGAADATDEVLRRLVVDRVGDVLQKYDDARLIRRVQVADDKGRVMFDLSRDEMLAERKKLPKEKKEEEE